MRLLLSILLTLILPLTTLAGGELKSNSITIEHDVGRSLPSGNPITAFGDLRVTNLSPIFQGSFEYTVDNTDLNTNTVANGGTVTQASAMAIVGTSTTTTSTALFQTKQHAKYRPGLGAVLRFTALFTTCTTETEQYIGLADEVGSSAAGKNDAERENIIDHTIVVNPGDTITLSGSSVASATIRAGILWKELF